MSQRSAAQHCHIDTPFCTIRKSHVTWNFAVPGPHSEEIRRCILLFLCTLVLMYSWRSRHGWREICTNQLGIPAYVSCLIWHPHRISPPPVKLGNVVCLIWPPPVKLGKPCLPNLASPAPLSNRWLAELLSGYETGHCRPRSTGRGLRVHSKRETRALHLFSLAVFLHKIMLQKAWRGKEIKPRCCWPAIFASILFSENEKGQRLHGLRRAVIVHAHCTCHEQRAMSKLNKRAGTGYHLSSDLFDSLRWAEISFLT